MNSILVSLYKLKIRNSVQPQTVMAMHEQEICSRPSNAKLSKIEDYGKKAH